MDRVNLRDPLGLEATVQPASHCRSSQDEQESQRVRRYPPGGGDRPAEPINVLGGHAASVHPDKGRDGLDFPPHGDLDPTNAAVRSAIRAELSALNLERKRSANNDVPVNKSGLRKMYAQAQGVLDHTQTALAELAKDLPDPERLLWLLQQIESKTRQRMKQIKIADAYGWETVELYEQDRRLGDDPEDAKRIKKAAQEAEAARKKAQALRRSKASDGEPAAAGQRPFRPGWQTRPGPGYGPAQGFGPQAAVPAPAFRAPWPGYAPPYGSYGYGPSLGYGNSASRCYNCWKPGHFAKGCAGHTSGAPSRK